MQFSPLSRHLIPLRSKYPPQHPVLKHLSLCFTLNVREQVSQPYRTIGRIIMKNHINIILMCSLSLSTAFIKIYDVLEACSVFS
jgi:hypothetical protein